MEDQIINSIDLNGHDKNNDLSSQPIAEDPYSKEILARARKAAKSSATILISGETGVGKEVLAHYIHSHSTFFKGPFVSVNCAALPENMIEAILFGYEKGAFTSSVNSYVGKFEQAHNGTLLLDEISEISIVLQAKLLRVLQEREVERLGGKRLIKVNVRIIAATNRDLSQQVKAGTFRKDLYYRLNVVPIFCAPLKNRPLDIIPLAEAFIAQHAQKMERTSPKMTEAAKEKLLSYCWPGNIREMDNIIQRTLIMLDGNTIDVDDINLQEDNIEIAAPDNVLLFNQFDSKFTETEARVIIDMLKETKGCRNAAAMKLNISPRTLRYKIAKLRSIGIKIP